MLIVRILVCWYTTQQFVIKWGTSTSMCFTTSNGVRQGGILSPRLFTLYIDDLSYVLRAINVGCFIDNASTNNYVYADDMCLLAPSAGGLQKLIDANSKYGNEHDILYNPIKSKRVIFLPKRCKLTVPTVSFRWQ